MKREEGREVGKKEQMNRKENGSSREGKEEVRSRKERTRCKEFSWLLPQNAMPSKKYRPTNMWRAFFLSCFLDVPVTQVGTHRWWGRSGKRWREKVRTFSHSNFKLHQVYMVEMLKHDSKYEEVIDNLSRAIYFKHNTDRWARKTASSSPNFQS